MANIKISELEQISNVENDDILPIVDSSATETKKIKISDLISNEYGTSQVKGYSQEYINNKLASSEWVSLGNTVYYKKCGNIITVRGYSSGDVPLVANDYKIVGTLPTDARPSMELGFPWARIGEGQIGLVRIYNNGAIGIYSTSAPSYWAFTITFII